MYNLNAYLYHLENLKLEYCTLLNQMLKTSYFRLYIYFTWYFTNRIATRFKIVNAFSNQFKLITANKTITSQY